MNKTAQFISGLLIFGFITTFVVFYFYKLTAERLEKKAKEIERVESHSYDNQIANNKLLARQGFKTLDGLGWQIKELKGFYWESFEKELAPKM